MLRVSDVVAGYGPAPVVNGVSLEVGPGEIKAILGPNNAGKSTVLKVICGLLPLNQGTVTMDGAGLASLAPEDIAERGVALVPERRRIFSEMTVMENLLLGSYCRRARAARKDSLELVYRLFPRLRERPKQLGGTLSGGEQEMLAIARGLMAHPKILLLDEPSLGLAPILVREIFGTLRGLAKEGMGILLAEQNATQALRVSSYAYVLAGGRVALEGASNTLDPSHVEDLYLAQAR